MAVLAVPTIRLPVTYFFSLDTFILVTAGIFSSFAS